MTISLDQLREWMDGRENEHLEFKEAKNNLSMRWPSAKPS
jgi:hypothetical protein